MEEQLQPERDRGVRESEDLRTFSSLSHIMSGGAARRCGGSGEEGVFQPLLRDTLTRTWSRRETRKNTGGVFMRAVSPEATVKVHCSGLADSRAAGQRIFTVYLPNSQLILFADFGSLNGGRCGGVEGDAGGETESRQQEKCGVSRPRPGFY